MRIALPHRRLTRTLTATVAASALLAGSGFVVAVAAGGVDHAAASTEEVYLRPADGVFHLDGHGWGHGHGLSQWGAQGAATHGVGYQQILRAYYPGTQSAALANQTIRVQLSVNDGIELRVQATRGLTATDGASGAHATLPSGPSTWRVIVDPAGLHVQSWSSGRWTPYALSGRTTLAGPVRLASPQPTLRVDLPDGTQRDYRGTLAAVRAGTGSMYTVLTLPMEDYLLGVVPRESPAYFAPEALKAQTVAARSYSAWKRDHAPAGAPWDICDSTMCQVFGGTRLIQGGSSTDLESASTTAAVRATAGQVLTYQGAPIFAEFSSSNGGWSTDGRQPYLTAHADPWDGLVDNGLHTWQATLRATDLEARYGSQGLAHFLVLRVISRDGYGEWGGRVQSVVLDGTNSRGERVSIDATGGGIYLSHTWPAFSDGLKSSWWHIRPSLGSTVVGQSTVTPVVRTPGSAQGDLTVSYRNTGLSSWPTAGLHLVLAPNGGPDPFVGGSTRPGIYLRNRTHPGAAMVIPGDVVDLRVHVDAAQAAIGVHPLHYRLQLASGPVFGSVVSWSLPVLGPLFRSRAAAAPLPAASADGMVLVPRSGATRVQVLVRNTGNVVWPVGGGVGLGTSAPRDRRSPSAGSDWRSASRTATLAAVAGVPGARLVRPGQVGVFELTIHGNGLPVGVSTETFEPVWDPYHWIDGAPITLRLVRYDSAMARAGQLLTPAISRLTLPAYPGGTATLTVTARNVGSQPWPVGGGFGLRLSGPGWSAPARPMLLTGNVTRPGATTVLSGEVGQWRVGLSAFHAAPGTYLAQFRAVSGFSWYAAPVTITIVVTSATFAGTVQAVSAPVTLSRNGSATEWFDVRNTSTVAWPVGGDVRSVAFSAAARAPDWLGPSRPGSVSENVSVPGARWVAPGQIARFRVTIAGNGRPAGSYRDTFGFGWEVWAAGAARIDLRYTLR